MKDSTSGCKYVISTEQDVNVLRRDRIPLKGTSSKATGMEEVERLKLLFLALRSS